MSRKGKKMRVPDEIVLPKRAALQPDPPVYDQGDCGACVVSGLTGLTIKEVYQRKGEWRPFSRPGLADFLSQLLREDLVHRYIDDVPLWPQAPSFYYTGLTGTQMVQQWFRYILMALDGGYYAVCNVAFERNICETLEPDHFVLICGARTQFSSNRDNAIQQELLVSCSHAETPEEEWVPVYDFLQNWGSFNAILIKPKTE